MSWNKSNSNKPKAVAPSKAPRVNRKLYYVLLGSLVLIGAAISICVFSRSSTNKAPEKAVRPKVSKTVKEQPNITTFPTEKQKPQKKLHFWEVDAAYTNGFSEVQVRKWLKEHRPPPGYTNDAAIMRAPAKYAIFPHEVENKLAALLTLEPGQSIIGSLDLQNVQADFLKSCEVPIVVTDEDTPETAALKNLMNEVKVELKERIAEGERLEDIISETQKEYQRLAQCRREVMLAIHDLKKEGIASEQELDDVLTAANRLLEEKGIAPIELGAISRQMFLRHIKKEN